MNTLRHFPNPPPSTNPITPLKLYEGARRTKLALDYKWLSPCFLPSSVLCPLRPSYGTLFYCILLPSEETNSLCEGIFRILFGTKHVIHHRDGLTHIPMKLLAALTLYSQIMHLNACSIIFITLLLTILTSSDLQGFDFNPGVIILLRISKHVP